jgi:glycosyltransferase involved in cell wall biosynthesis
MAPSPTSPTPAQPLGRVLVWITEDWFVLSHFRPLLRALVAGGADVCVATRDAGRRAEIEALGVRVAHFAVDRANIDPIRETVTAARFASLIRKERPDILHLIGMKPMVVGGLASKLAPGCDPALVLHVIGTGHVAVSQAFTVRKVVRPAALGVIAQLLSRPRSWVFTEQEDDLAFLINGGARPGQRFTILGGAGVDPEHFAPMPPPSGDVPTVGYVGRMIRVKGVDTLVAAFGLLGERGVRVRASLYGACDAGNPDALSEDALAALSADPASQITWHGPIRDVRQAWAGADMFVLATRGGEGMPRAMLEAAACARPLIVTDVPGCRTFVRNGVEGFVVAPGDASGLADAIERLAADPGMRQRMGLAARARVLSGYTERHVEEGILAGYRALSAIGPAKAAP